MYLFRPPKRRAEPFGVAGQTATEGDRKLGVFQPRRDSNQVGVYRCDRGRKKHALEVFYSRIAWGLLVLQLRHPPDHPTNAPTHNTGKRELTGTSLPLR